MIIPHAVLLAGWLLMAQAPAAPAKPPAPRAAASQLATHATKGVVKAISANAIVITRRAAGKRMDTSFVINSGTQRVGAPEAGSTVEIRYRTDGRQKVATAVSVEAAPQ